MVIKDKGIARIPFTRSESTEGKDITGVSPPYLDNITSVDIIAM